MRTRITRNTDGDATLWLDRPAKRNAIDRSMLQHLSVAVGEIESDRSIRTLLVRGSDGYFSAGADIGDWADPSPSEAEEMSRLGTAVFDRLASLSVPTLAVIEGGALGGGLELALACDVRLAAPAALIGYPEARLGNLTSWGGLTRLVDAVGLAHTRSMFLTGTPVSGRRAYEIGLVHAAPADLEAAVSELVADLGAAEPTAVRTFKLLTAGLEARAPIEPVLAAFFSRSEASRERKQAFLDRRKVNR
ncbi:enoyl-CoA hydratase/isomerase family protein [Nonomuraea insulae]|uniref:Enoyl-CoA hydratase/isomerase family protein n=1 Tax=Nonomuraea insulae TaxID=1616787 RepID=A0ABW1CPQ4_9ACTN